MHAGTTVLPCATYRHSHSDVCHADGAEHAPAAQLDTYRELSELLDPMLQRIAAPLIGAVSAAARAGPADADWAQLIGASRMLRALASTRHAIDQPATAGP